MSASVTIEKRSESLSFLKTAASYVGSGVLDYVKNAMPTSSSILSDARSSVKDVQQAFTVNTSEITPLVRKIRSQANLKGISNWFFQKEDELSTNDDSAKYDDGTETGKVSITEIESSIDNADKNADKISRTVVESVHKLADVEITALANMTHTMNQQSATIKAGFESVNNTLKGLLEVVTKNTSALLELQIANSKAEEITRDNNDAAVSKKRMMGNMKFDLSDYKKIVASNFKESDLGMQFETAMGFLQNGGLKEFLKPDNLISLGISGGLNKLFPKLNKNMETLDKAVNETIMSSLIRLGESNKDVFGVELGKIFGIDPKRAKADTKKKELEVKNVAYNSIANEYVTNGIPGYLRKILVALGGEDVIFDPKSRSFKTQKSIRKDYMENIVNVNSLSGASKTVRDTLGNEDFTKMMYSLMMNDLSTRTGRNGDARAVISDFNDIKSTRKYLSSLLGDNRSKRDNKNVNEFARRLSQLPNGYGNDIIMQASKEAIKRNKRVEDYLDEIEKYGTDISFIKDSRKQDARYIKKQYGRADLTINKNQSDISSRSLSGSDYTNRALYEIYRRLNKGINVFKTGEKLTRSTAYIDYKDKYLSAPAHHKPKPISDAGGASITAMDKLKRRKNESNPLVNDEESGENLTAGERFKRWGTKRGGEFKDALFRGDASDLSDVIRQSFLDIAGLAGNKGKEWYKNKNEEYHNAWGSLKHKAFGTSYQYTDENGQRIEVSENKTKDGKSGGYAGYLRDMLFGKAEDIKRSTSNWFREVSGYFDYGDKDKDSKGDIASKRKKFLGASVGAFAGLGLLGTPMGLLVGGLAGNALSSMDIGSKIKERLFGKDKDGKPNGLLNKAASKVLKPIQFQLEKTMNFVGNQLKKNILGPLSDIGFAIKERITKHVESGFKKVMGYITAPFKKFGKWAGGLLAKAAGGLFRGGVNALGMFTRGNIGIKTELTGGVLRGIGNLIAPDKDAKDKLKERRRERKEDIKQSSDIYKNQETWEAYKAQKKAEKEKTAPSVGLSEYTAETRKVVDNTEKTNESLNEIKGSQERSTDAVENLNKLASTSGSIFTHDQGIHDKLDRLYNWITGNTNPTSPKQKNKHYESSDTPDMTPKESAHHMPKAPTVNNEQDPILGSALSSIVTMGASGDTFTNQEAEVSRSTMTELSKDKPNKSTVTAGLTRMLNIQRKNSDENDEKDKDKDSFWSTIFGALGNLGSIVTTLGIIGVAIAAIKGWGDNDGILHRILKGIGNFVDDIIDDDTTGSAAGTNILTAPADMRVSRLSDYINPLASISHIDKNGANEFIDNTAATKAKNSVLYGHNIRTAIQNTLTGGSQRTLQSQFHNVAAGIYKKKSDFWGNHFGSFGKWRQKKANAKYDRQVEMAKSSNSILGGVKRSAIQIGVTSIAGSAAGGLVSYGAKSLGMSDEGAEKAGKIGSAGTTAALTIGYMKKGKNSVIGKVTDGLTHLFDAMGKKFKKSKLFGKAATKIDDMMGSVSKKIINAVADTKWFKIIEQKLLDAGVLKQLQSGATVLSAGVMIAVGAISGAIGGYCGVEHLFGVLPGEADAGMKTISVLMEAALGAVSWIPEVNIIVPILDVIDMISTAIFGKGLTQYLAEFLYRIGSAIGGKGFKNNGLDAKQGDFNRNLEEYNKRFGTSLSATAYNDMINNTGWGTRLWKGKTVVEDGNVQYYEDGTEKRKGGMRNSLVGQDEVFVKDAEGNLMKDSKGKNIVAVDKYGQTIKRDNKFWDFATASTKASWRNLVGGNVYATDENGNVLYDENGNKIVDHKEDNIFKRVVSGKGILSEEMQNALGKTKNKKYTEEDYKRLDNIKNKVNGYISMVTGGGNALLGSMFKTTSDSIKNGLSAMKEDQYVTDENGEIIKDENGKPLKKSKIGSFLKGASNGFMASITKQAKDVFSIFKKDKEEQYELDENGKPLYDADGKPVKKGGIKDFLSSGINKVKSLLMKPFQDIIDISKDDNGNIDSSKLNKNLVKKALSTMTGILTGMPNIGIGGPETAPKKYYDDNGYWTGPGNEFRDYAQNHVVDTKNTVGVTGMDAQYEGLEESTPEKYTQDNTKQGGNPLNKDYKIISKFGPRSQPVPGTHKGIDLVPKDNSGIAGVTSRFNGKIVEIKNNVNNGDRAEVGPDGKWTYEGDNEEGNMVAIQTEDGSIVRHMHLKYGSIPKELKVGDTVSIGDKLGSMGTTGWATGPHLHYEIQDKNGNFIDPESTLEDKSKKLSEKGATLSDIASQGAKIISGNSVSVTSGADGSGYSEDGSENSNGIGTIFDELRKIGQGFLYKLTGGLIGSNPNESNESNGVSVTGNNTGVGVPSSENTILTNSPNSQWVAIVRDVKKLVAAQAPGYNQGGYINIDYNNKTYRTRTDCTGIICTMLKIYGALPESSNLNSTAMLKQGAIPKGFTMANWPGWDGLVEGDIMVVNKHAEIFAYNDGSSHFVYNGGSTKSLASPGATYTTHKEGYTVIWRCNEAAKVSVSDGGPNNSVMEGVDNSKIDVKDRRSLWHYLRSLGYNKLATSGIMGAWQEETGNRADRLEGDYFLKPDVNAVMSSPEALDDYTLNRLFPGYKRNNLGIKQSIYEGGDGHYYPGVGIAQWTGRRAKALLDFAKSNGLDWRGYKAQLDYFKDEMDNKYDKNNTLNSLSNVEEASEWFTRHYEGNTNANYINKRKGHALSIYNEFANSEDFTPYKSEDKDNKNIDIDFSKIHGAADGSQNTGVVGADAQYEGIGGPTETKKISINKQNYVNPEKNRVQNKPSNVQAVTTNSTSKSNIIDFNKAASNISSVSDYNESRYNGSGNQNKELIDLLYQVIYQLENISNNTKTSTEHLAIIKDSDFVDTKLRNELKEGSKAMARNRNTSTSYHQPNQTNNRMVANLARPI